jgi:ABC-type multidrug transport system fused ATPase/permease subunit
MAKDVRFFAENLSIEPGKAIAIIGPSGAGKSTFLKTLAGLVEAIEWDGTPSWEEVRSDASMVSQEPFLFDDSIAENLCYGLAERPTEASVWEALETVNIAAEIKALPDGLRTRLRAIGSNVSGGQLQRLVIARSLLRGKSLWLLDEATSAVDAKSEKDITLRLIGACRAEGRALLAVTHRLTWLEAFDAVWFVEDGEVRLAGPHAALLRERRYRDYCAAAGERTGGAGG